MTANSSTAGVVVPRSARSFALPPGPKTPAAWQLLHYSQSPLAFLEGCARRYGSSFTVRMAGYGTFVMLSETEAVRDLFRGDAHVLHSGEGNEFLSLTVGPNSVLVLDEEPHARQRQVLLPALKGERMRAYFPAMVAETLDAMRAWPRGRPFPVLESMRRITLRVILRSTLGISAGPELDRFEALVERLLGFSRTRYTLVLLKIIPLWLMRANWQPFQRLLREVDREIYGFLANRRREIAIPRPESIVDDLLATRHPDGSPLTDAEIRDAVLTILTAGYDTTSVALAWTLEQACARPDAIDAISAETTRVTAGAALEAEHVPQLHYLDAVIREALRLRTIFPFVVRLTKGEFKAGGRVYPPGVLLAPCIHSIHRREDLYPDPERFDPNRFLERKFSAHEWLPFGGGGRMCLGMAFAMHEMKVVLATIFAHLRPQREPGARSHPVRRGLALTPHDGCRLVVRV